MTDYRERAEAFSDAERERLPSSAPSGVGDAEHAEIANEAYLDRLASLLEAVAAERDAVWRERLERLVGELEESPPFWRHAIEVFSGYDGEREVGKRIAARLRALGEQP